jgi:hypothetical protein
MLDITKQWWVYRLKYYCKPLTNVFQGQ